MRDNDIILSRKINKSISLYLLIIIVGFSGIESLNPVCTPKLTNWSLNKTGFIFYFGLITDVTHYQKMLYYIKAMVCEIPASEHIEFNAWYGGEQMTLDLWMNSVQFIKHLDEIFAKHPVNNTCDLFESYAFSESTADSINDKKGYTIYYIIPFYVNEACSIGDKLESSRLKGKVKLVEIQIGKTKIGNKKELQLHIPNMDHINLTAPTFSSDIFDKYGSDNSDVKSLINKIFFPIVITTTSAPIESRSSIAVESIDQKMHVTVSRRMEIVSTDLSTEGSSSTRTTGSQIEALGTSDTSLGNTNSEWMSSTSRAIPDDPPSTLKPENASTVGELVPFAKHHSKSDQMLTKNYESWTFWIIIVVVVIWIFLVCLSAFFICLRKKTSQKKINILSNRDPTRRHSVSKNPLLDASRSEWTSIVPGSDDSSDASEKEVQPSESYNPVDVSEFENETVNLDEESRMEKPKRGYRPLKVANVLKLE